MANPELRKGQRVMPRTGRFAGLPGEIVYITGPDVDPTYIVAFPAQHHDPRKPDYSTTQIEKTEGYGLDDLVVLGARRTNPAGSILLSRAAEDITFLRLDDGKRDVHRFPVDSVHIRLASDKTVHLSRPDGVAVFPREPSGLLSKAVKQLRYRHAEDGEDYFHDFDPGVSLVVTGKRAHLYRPDGKPLWGRFN